MATRPKGYGLTRELADKINAKYSIEDEQEIIAWLCDITNVDGPAEEGPDAFRQWLSDGTILCALMDVLQPGICKRPHDVSKIKLQALKGHKANENISFFLQAAQNYGVPSSNLFQTVDLTDGQNMAQVQTGLYNIGSMAQKKKFEGPVIGAKMADENRRDFSQATLQAGKNIISLQMGTNQVASQKGMTPYGLGRQMITKET